MTTTTELTGLFAQTEEKAKEEKRRRKFREKVAFLKDTIIRTSEIQKKEKQILRQPHHKILDVSSTMSRVAQRAHDITWCLITYAHLRGKESSHFIQPYLGYGLARAVQHTLEDIDKKQ